MAHVPQLNTTTARPTSESLSFVPRLSITQTRQRCLPRSLETDTEDSTIVTRRVLVSATVALTGFVFAVPSALALLPDDDDADLISKAKAKRKEKIQEELATERRFVKGKRSRKQTARLVASIQNGVYYLAQSGDKLESETLGEASNVLKENWIEDFQTAATDLSTGVSGADDTAQQIFTGIASLQTTVEKGDVTESKKEFVKVVTLLQEWTDLVGISASLNGI